MRIIVASASIFVVLAGCGGAAGNKSGNEAAAAPANGSATTNGSNDTANGAISTNSTGSANGTASATNVAVPGGLPLYAGATDVKESGGTVSFKAPASWTEVSQFYVRSAEEAGYRMSRGQVGSSERLTLTRGGETVHITGTVVLGGRSEVVIAPAG